MAQGHLQASMKRSTFLTSLLAFPALALTGFSPKPTETIPEIKPLPNTKQFGIEVMVYPYTGEFMYFCPNRPSCREWLASFTTPFTFDEFQPLTADFNGYAIKNTILKPSFWEPPWPTWHCLNECWGTFYLTYHYQAKIGTKITKRIDRIDVRTGFLDTAAPVYNDTPEDRDRFWRRSKSIYVPYHEND